MHTHSATYCKMTLFDNPEQLDFMSVYMVAGRLTRKDENIRFHLKNRSEKNDTSDITRNAMITPELYRDIARKMRSYHSQRKHLIFLGRGAGVLSVKDATINYAETLPMTYMIGRIKASEDNIMLVDMWLENDHFQSAIPRRRGANKHNIAGWIEFTRVEPRTITNSSVGAFKL